MEAPTNSSEATWELLVKQITSFFNESEQVDQITEVLKIRLVFCHLQIQCVQAYRKANKLLPIPLKLERWVERKHNKMN